LHRHASTNPINPNQTGTTATSTTARRTAGRHRTFIALGTAGLIAAGTLFSAPLIANAAVDQQASARTTVALSQQGSLEHDHLGVYDDIARYKAESKATAVIASANTVIASAASKVDASALQANVSALADYKLLSSGRIEKLLDTTNETMQQTAKAIAAADAAAEAARVANTPDGARAQASDLMASTYGWGADQFQCLDSLWAKESGWNVNAYNASSGATGIPQALPGSKMATIAADWQTSARTQIIWGLDYISRSYGSPCSAWSHSQSMNWY
jgi:hypothetical protein